MPENYEETITLAGDLHARPAGQLAVAAAQFSSTVQLIVAGGGGGVGVGVGVGKEADAKSVLAVMQLGASSGQQVTVRAAGPDAEKAVETLIGILSAVGRVGD
jgi:phosphotransferase system HPr (HPr) family protein